MVNQIAPPPHRPDRSSVLPHAELMIGIVSLFAATICVPSTLPTGVGVSDGFADGSWVSIGLWPPDGSATGLTASALVQIQPTLNPVVAKATSTRTSAPINRARLFAPLTTPPPSAPTPPAKPRPFPASLPSCPYAACCCPARPYAACCGCPA